MLSIHDRIDRSMASCRTVAMTTVRIENLSKSFGPVQALKGINLTIEAGELFFLLGPSGCGKTTLLRCLAGFCRPDSGTIYFGDTNVTNHEPNRRASAMVFQNYALWPHLSVFENVAFGLRQRRCGAAEIRDRVTEALAMVHLEKLADRKPNALSGGQQQRVALARALVVRPDCLLLDEPLSNLDAKLRAEMRNEIRRLCKQFGLTAVYVTHDRSEALSVADRIAVFSEGEILQVGSPVELYRRPRVRLVADFIGETNLFSGTVEQADHGEALVTLPCGPIRAILANPDNPPAAGSVVTVSIRPECIRLDAYPADENCFSGAIEDMSYFGEVAHYTFRVDETEMRIAELNPRHLSTRSAQSLYAWFDAEDAVVLED